MKTSIYPVNDQSSGPNKVQFCNTEEEIQELIEKRGETINLVYAGTVEKIPEIYKGIIDDDKHPAFADAKLNYENVIIFQWSN